MPWSSYKFESGAVPVSAPTKLTRELSGCRHSPILCCYFAWEDGCRWHRVRTCRKVTRITSSISASKSLRLAIAIAILNMADLRLGLSILTIDDLCGYSAVVAWPARWRRGSSQRTRTPARTVHTEKRRRYLDLLLMATALLQRDAMVG